MGTFSKDIVSHEISSIIEHYFNEEVEMIACEVFKKTAEHEFGSKFDIIATTKSSVILVETISSPDPSYLKEFHEQVIPRFRRLFPEFDHLPLVPVLATLRFEDSFLPLATKAGIYLLAYREWDYMDLLNFDELQPKTV